MTETWPLYFLAFVVSGVLTFAIVDNVRRRSLSEEQRIAEDSEDDDFNVW